MRLWLSLYRGLIALFPNLSASRSPADQAIVEAQTSLMTLYTNPGQSSSRAVISYCLKEKLPIETRDPESNNTFAEDLRLFGGKLETPCLKVRRRDKGAKYIYGKDAILEFLRRSF